MCTTCSSLGREGSHPNRLDRRPDGTLNVVNGRHRIEIARELGITSLPAQVTGP
jgi:ParB-like chromosome segregation protein Spo0J